VQVNRRAAGFTLLELLVVIFIVGIIAAMATLSVGTATRDQGLQREIERVADLVRLASEEAVMQNREFGLTIYRREYEFSRFDATEREWIPLGNDSGPLASRSFPPDTEVELEIDGRRVALDAEIPERKPRPEQDGVRSAADRLANLTGTDDNSRPQILILSSGDVTPFAVRLAPESGGDGSTIRVSETGAIEKIREGA